jgi:signal transduction histidine kinase/ligand-binding sensor domain-containing protein/CheY-like chemotaxis protein/AraC-like DNA-binding protein
MLQLKVLIQSLIAVIIFFLSAFETLPQNIPAHFDNISIDQGLPSNTINSVYQDKKGFIWIGTDVGLVRYDAYNFKLYSHKKDDINSLSDGFITSILEDSAGNFWIGTRNGGLNKFDRNLNKFSSLKYLSYESNSIRNNNIISLIEDRGTIWAVTDSGLSKMNSSGTSFTNFRLPADISDKPHLLVSKIIADNGILWIGTLNGLIEFNSDNHSVSIFRINPKGDFHIRSLIKENESNLLIASDEGVFRFNKSGKQFSQLLKEPVNDIITAKDGKLWCASAANGIILFDINNGTKNYIAGNGSTGYKNIFIDKAGSIWLSSPNVGISICHSGHKSFNIISNNPGNPNTLSYNFVNKSFSDFPLKEGIINSVLKDNFGNLWVGTSNGLYIQRLNNSSFEKISFISHVIKDQPVNSMAQDKSGNIWLGINDHLVKYALPTNESLIVDLKLNSASSTNTINISCILSINDNIWISSSDGLYKYVPGKNLLKLFRDNDPFNIENQFQTLFQDWEGHLWLGSKEGGLKSFNTETNQFVSYKKENGLPSNNILSILEDLNGFLWLGTDKGLVKFNRQYGNIILYTSNDGIPSNHFLPNSSWISQAGEFFFGTANGIFSFFPSDIYSNKYIPPVVLTSFKIFNKEADLNYETAYASEFEIPYKQNELSFQVSALNFINPQQNNYAYKLEGFNNEWHYINSAHSISFTNLDPGSYTLRIKAANNDGVWNESGLSVKLIVLPPWYKTWWAYSLFLILIILIYLGIRMYEFKKLKSRNELRLKKLQSDILMEADKVKSDFFAKISNDLKEPLIQITAPLSKLKEKMADADDKQIIELVETNTRLLLHQLNHFLDLSQLEAASMKLNVTRNDFVLFIRGLIMNFEQSAKLKNIQLTLHSPMDHINLYFDPEKIEKIIFNILSNAIKFTSTGGTVLVYLELKSNRLYVRVRDNGIGISSEKIHLIFDKFSSASTSSAKNAGGSGIGLYVTKKLVELHKGEVQVSSTPGIGTTFSFWLNTDEKTYHLSEIYEPDKINLTFRPISTINETSTTFLDHNEKQIVLLIGENPDMRRLIASQLEEVYAIYEASNGTEGFGIAKEFIPDIIVYDILYDDINISEFCTLLRNDFKTSHIPIILLAPNNSFENKISGSDASADDYLAKPFNKLDLLLKIKHLIALRRKNRDMLSRETISGFKFAFTSDIKLGTVDNSFVKKLLHIIENNYPSPDFKIEQLCSLLEMNEPQLRRKMSALFNKSPHEFILKYRLYKASKLIREEGKSETETAYAVGFDNLAYFAKCYRIEFGKLPV